MAELRDFSQPSADTIKLYDSLKGASPGDQFSYAQLSAILGIHDIRERRQTLYSALTLLVNHKSLVFGVVRGVGIKCLADEETVSGEVSTIKSIGRKARKGLKKLATVEVGKLPDGARNLALVNRATLANMRYASNLRTRERLSQEFSNNASAPGSTDKLLESMTRASAS